MTSVFRNCKFCDKLQEEKVLLKKKKVSVVRWDLESHISSDYLAHCSHPFFMSIRIELSASYSLLSKRSSDTDFIGQGVYKP